MAHTFTVTEYLRSGGATADEIDDFLDFCGVFRNQGKVGRYETYRLWARCLRKRRTPFKQGGKFIFHEDLKNYMRYISAGDIVDAESPPDAVFVSADDFVKYVVRYLDDAL